MNSTAVGGKVPGPELSKFSGKTLSTKTAYSSALHSGLCVFILVLNMIGATTVCVAGP